MTANLAESANAEVSALHSLVGTAKRAAERSLSDCVKLQSSSSATLTAVTTWWTQVSKVTLPVPAEPAELTAELTNVQLTTTLGGGWIEGWASQADGAREALTGARDAAEKLRAWAEPASKGYSSAVLHLRGLIEWLDWLYTQLGQVAHGVKGVRNVDVSTAAEHLGNVAGWIQDQAGRAGEFHGAFDAHHSELGAATRSLPGSYALLALASKAVPDSLLAAARTIGTIARQMDEQARE